MSAHNKAISRSAVPVSRVAALVAFALALGLLVWRASDVMLDGDRGAPVYTSQEMSLLNILEPVAGAGNVRVSLVDSSGGRNIVVLLNSAIDVDTAKVLQLTQRALAVDPAAGDMVTIDAAVFSNGLAGSLNFAEYLELVALLSLGGLCGWQAFRPETKLDVGATELRLPSLPQQAVLPAEPPVHPPESANAFDGDALLKIAKHNPAKAAQIIRDWMNAEEAA